MTDEAEPEHDHDEDGGELPHLDFATFIMSLGSSVLVHLGEMQHPDHPGTQKNLPIAKQTLDILAMLRDKTRGNLNKEETELVDHLLYDLRMKYVAAKKTA